MEKDFANIEGMFKTNTDIVDKAILDVAPEYWTNSLARIQTNCCG